MMPGDDMTISPEAQASFRRLMAEAPTGDLQPRSIPSVSPEQLARLLDNTVLESGEGGTSSEPSPDPLNEGDCACGGVELPPEMLLPMAWEIPRGELSQKALHIVRLFGLHTTRLSEADQDRIIALFNDILGIRPLRRP